MPSFWDKGTKGGSFVPNVSCSLVPPSVVDSGKLAVVLRAGKCAVPCTGVPDMLREDPFPGILQSLAVPQLKVSVRPTTHNLQFLIDILFLI